MRDQRTGAGILLHEVMHLAGHSHNTEFGVQDLDTFINAATECVFFDNRFEDTRAAELQGLQTVAAASTRGDGPAAPPSYVPYPGDLDEFIFIE